MSKIKIGEHIKIIPGFPFNSSLFNIDGEGFPLIRIRDLLTSKIETFYKGEFLKEFIIEEGDILIGMDGDFHIVKWKNKTKALLNQRIMKVAQKDGAQINIEYFYYFLFPFLSDVWEKTTATTVKHLSTYDVSEAEVEFPKLEIQTKIAKILSTADAVIEKTQATVAKYKAIKQGMLQDLLTYGLDKQNRRNKKINSQFYKPIKYFAKVRRGASPRPIDNPEYFGGDVGWIRISDVTQSFKYLNKTEQYVSPLGESLSVRVDKGDIIMSICGTVGKPVIIDIPACIHDGFVQLYDLKEVDIDFLYYSLQYHEENFLKKGQPGTQVNLNTTIVEDFIVYFPPIEEQKKIGKILNSIDNKLQTEQTYLQKMQSLKKGLMKDLLSGRKQVKVSEELVIQNEN